MSEDRLSVNEQLKLARIAIKNAEAEFATVLREVHEKANDFILEKNGIIARLTRENKSLQCALDEHKCELSPVNSYGDMIIERDATIKAQIDEYRLLNDEYRRVVVAKNDMQRQLDEQINTIKVQYGDIRRLQDEKQKYNDLCMSQHAEIERLKDKLHAVKTKT